MIKKAKKMPSRKQSKPEYKIIETSIVTDERLESIVNEWVQAGWTFDHIQFATRDASKRPAMAFVFFIRETESNDPKKENEMES